jgi:hypothetical protein
VEKAQKNNSKLRQSFAVLYLLQDFAQGERIGEGWHQVTLMALLEWKMCQKPSFSFVSERVQGRRSG